MRSNVSAGEEACLRQVAIWVKLHHPHVRKLFGACYVGSPYVIHELSLSSFPDIPTWRFLRGCALGLEYVHERGLAHENLSMRTLHSSYEFKGMLTGLGLVRIDDSTAASDRPSVAADVYAVGHAMFEFITDRLGPNEDESSQLPSEQPYYVNDVVWKLLGRLCADDPADPIGMLEAAHVIEDIEKDADRDDFWDDEDSAQPAVELVDDLDSYVIQSADQTVAEILEQVDDLCDDVAEFIDINRAVYGRLVDVRDQLVAAGPLPIELLEDFSSILWRFYLVLEQRSASEFSAVATICAAETVATRNYGLHHSLDRLILCTPELSSASSIHNWRPSWKETRQRQQSKLHSYMDCPIENLASLQAESPENMTLLCFEASCRSSSSLSQVGLPVWFIPPHQVELGKHLADGAFGVVSLGKWFDTDVIVKQVLTNQADTENREQFLQEVTLWSSLNYDNLIKMYGACHEGQPFFKCERANQGTLIEYLANRGSFQAWWSIWEAAKGLQHLHEHGIIHGDLKGNNITVCDGVAKLADFGLSTFASNVNRLGATGALGAFRWKAPECLSGSSPSFASDIYSFAMCIIEAVGGEFPWGNSMSDQVVQYKVVKMKQLPPRPKNFTDAQWHLVSRMCAFEPEKRPTAAAVVHLVWKVKTVSWACKRIVSLVVITSTIVGHWMDVNLAGSRSQTGEGVADVVPSSCFE